MAGFGDNTTQFQRAVMFNGARCEFGCYTAGNGSNSVSIPTTLSKCVMGIAISDGTNRIAGVAGNQDITASTVDFSFADATHGIKHYLVVGW